MLAIDLWAYKSESHRNQRAAGERLKALLRAAMEQHESCLAQRAGVDRFDLIAPVPSASGRTGEHPLVRLMGDSWTRGRLDANVFSRGLGSEPGHRPDADRFRARRLNGRSLLIVDDTWTTGSNALSAVKAARDAGASAVGVVAIGRHFDPLYNDECEAYSLSAHARPFTFDNCCAHRPAPWSAAAPASAPPSQSPITQRAKTPEPSPLNPQPREEIALRSTPSPVHRPARLVSGEASPREVWEDVTGKVLSPTHRLEFEERPETAELSRYDTQWLREAAVSVRSRSNGELRLEPWLLEIRSIRADQASTGPVEAPGDLPTRSRPEVVTEVPANNSIRLSTTHHERVLRHKARNKAIGLQIPTDVIDEWVEAYVATHLKSDGANG